LCHKNCNASPLINSSGQKLLFDVRTYSTAEIENKSKTIAMLADGAYLVNVIDLSWTKAATALPGVSGR